VLVAGVAVALSSCTGDKAAPAPDGSVSTTGGTDRSAWAELPVGDPPRIPYVAGRRYVTPTGKDEWLPGGGRGISGVVRFAEGLLVSDATYFEGTNGLDLVVGGKRIKAWSGSSHCSSGGPVLSSRRGRVAWVTVRCPESADRSIGAVHVANADGSGEISELLGAGLARVVGFLGDRVVYNAGFTGGAWVTTLGGVSRRIPGIDQAVDTGREVPWLIGQRRSRAQVVVDVNGNALWRLESGNLIAFSPNDQRVLAVMPKRRLALLDSGDGRELARIEVPDGFDVWATVWETNESLLSLVRRDGAVAVVRVWLNGDIERVTSLRSVNAGAPYVLVASE